MGSRSYASLPVLLSSRCTVHPRAISEMNKTTHDQQERSRMGSKKIKTETVLPMCGKDGGVCARDSQLGTSRRHKQH
eukprot:scaffold3421_cov181-Amphora_coffeaeformis.AAC.11